MSGRDRGRLTYVSQWYRPEPVNAPEWTAKGLQSAGWNVTVLTGIPNYPDGEVKPGYVAWRPMTEMLDGIRIRRAPLYPSHDRSSVGRVLNYVSWAISASIVGLGTLARSRVSYVYSSPATAALPSMVARVVAGRPYVLCIQDVWPDSVFASGFLTSGLIRRVAEAGLNAFVNASYRMAKAIVVISPGMRDLLISRGVPADKVTLVYNWVDEQVFHPVVANRRLRERVGLSDEDFLVVYAGNHGAAQGLATFVNAIASIPTERRCHGVLIGDGVEKADLRDLAHRVAPGRVHFLAPVPATEVPDLIAGGDLHVACLVDDPLFAVTMPSKIQSTLACGLPLVVSVPGDAARIITEAGAGVAAAAGDAQALAQAIQSAQSLGPEGLREMGRRGRELYDREMCRAVSVARLDALLGSESNMPGSDKA